MLVFVKGAAEFTRIEVRPRVSALFSGFEEANSKTLMPPACPIGSALTYLPVLGSYVLNRLSRDRPDDSSPLAS
jgi:hypothetical protein